MKNSGADVIQSLRAFRRARYRETCRHSSAPAAWDRVSQAVDGGVEKHYGRFKGPSWGPLGASWASSKIAPGGLFEAAGAPKHTQEQQTAIKKTPSASEERPKSLLRARERFGRKPKAPIFSQRPKHQISEGTRSKHRLNKKQKRRDPWQKG